MTRAPRRARASSFTTFPAGKSGLVRALAAFQAERVLDAQRPWLDTLDSWEAWERWNESVLAHYGTQPHSGGAHSSVLAGRDEVAAAEVADHMERWRAYLRAGTERMRAAGHLRPDADPESLSLAVFATVQGGLLLTQSMHALDPLEAALTGALTILRAHKQGRSSLI